MKRNINESFEDYKTRRKKENEITKNKLKPKMYWDSPKLGTYIVNK